MPRGTYQIVNSKVEDWAASYNDPKFHAVMCDPPYGIAFMGKKWDDTGGPLAFQQQARVWGEALIPLLYPGAILLCFGGTRTWHRLACGLEDAGLEMWDTIMWLYGQGFPKAQDVSKLIDAANGDGRRVVGRKVIAGGMISGRRELAGAGSESWHRPWMDDPEAYDRVCQVTEPGSTQSFPWSGHKTCALKPAWEPVLCFKAPAQGKTYAELAMNYGSGCLNVDGGRIAVGESDDPRLGGNGDWGTGTMAKNVYGEYAGDRVGSSPLGRYPANLALECTCEHVKVVDEPSTLIDKPCASPRIDGFKWGTMQGNRGPRGYNGKMLRHTDPNCPAAMLDAQVGELTSGASSDHRNSDITNGIYGTFKGYECYPLRGANSGGASRFFYCSKASREEREAGYESLPVVSFGQSNAAKAAIERGEDYENSNNGMNATKDVRNHHPTIKPIDLCRWLATLLLPPDSVKPRRLLVPFAGSGSEMIGAIHAGWDEVTGIEQDAEYCKIAEARLVAATKQETLF